MDISEIPELETDLLFAYPNQGVNPNKHVTSFCRGTNRYK